MGLLFGVLVYQWRNFSNFLSDKCNNDYSHPNLIYTGPKQGSLKITRGKKGYRRSTTLLQKQTHNKTIEKTTRILCDPVFVSSECLQQTRPNPSDSTESSKMKSVCIYVVLWFLPSPCNLIFNIWIWAQSTHTHIHITHTLISVLYVNISAILKLLIRHWAHGSALT